MTAATAPRAHPRPIPYIVREVCDALAVHERALRSKGRTAEVALARQTAMFLIRQFTRMSLPEIAREFEKLNHCTVIHAIAAVTDRAATDPDFRAKLDELIRRCNEEFAG